MVVASDVVGPMWRTRWTETTVMLKTEAVELSLLWHAPPSEVHEKEVEHQELAGPKGCPSDSAATSAMEHLPDGGGSARCHGRDS